MHLQRDLPALTASAPEPKVCAIAHTYPLTDGHVTASESETCNCAALRQAARRVTRLYDEALTPVGIGLNQFSILSRIARIGPRSVQQLAQTLVMDRSTLGHLLRPLEERGLVKLSVSPEDKRGRVVMLTAAGKALRSRAHPLWERAQKRFKATFGREPAARLRRTLKRIATSDF
jgi:DNA-binding MarR family transcriptional regulator